MQAVYLRNERLEVWKTVDLWDERKDGCKLFVSGMRCWRYGRLLICGMRGRLNGRGLITLRERMEENDYVG
jgi:hypothetical protein